MVAINSLNGLLPFLLYENGLKVSESLVLVNSVIAPESLAPSEQEQLKRYLPSALLEALMSDSEGQTQIAEHLANLLEATMSHLPKLIVSEQVGLAASRWGNGRFLTGTLLFADISGFTAMSEKLSQTGREGAEEVTQIVNRHFTVMLEQLRTQDGQLIRFGGDALLGLFLEQPQGESSATRAVQAAIAMQAAMIQFANTETSQGTFPLKMSVGLHNGRFLAAQLGDAQNMEYALFGKDVNATADIESAASAGQIMLDYETAQASEAGCAFAPVPNHPNYLLVQQQEPAQRAASDLAGESKALIGHPSATPELLHQLGRFTPFLPVGLLSRLRDDPSAASFRGEHRLVATLFANVDGISELIEGLGEAQEALIVDCLNDYLIAMRDAIAPYGGVINKIDLYNHGDKLMVTFGAPLAHEDDAERAARAALAMQTQMKTLAKVLSQKAGLPNWRLVQRIGISYGYVFAGYVGSSWRHEYTVMGDAVNLAARLMSVAEEGQVIVSPDVRRHIDGVLRVVQRGEVRLKGKAEPVAIFEVTGTNGNVEQRRRAVQLRSPLVGRDAALAKLQTAVSDLRARRGGLAFVGGAAGQGKSRLVRELRQRHGRDLHWIKSRCLSYTESVSFWLFQDVLRRLLNLSPDDAEDKMRAQLEQMLADFLGDAAAENRPFLANFLGLPLTGKEKNRLRYLDAEAVQRRTFMAWRELLASCAKQTPLLIALDDLQWLDNASLNLLEYLLPLMEQLPILFVLQSRPDKRKGIWQLLESSRQLWLPHFTEIGLDGLSDQDAQQLLYYLVPDVDWPKGMDNLLLGRAEGNPLFLEEVIRALINDGVLQQSADGRWQVDGTGQQLAVPDTLEGVLQARLDRLSEPNRWTVQVASVIGRYFPYDVLHHAEAEQPELALQGRLQTLGQMEMIHETQRQPEAVFGFRHTLLHEVSYQSMAISSRRLYHQRIVQYLENGRSQGWRGSENILPLLAHHAYAGGDWLRGLRYQMEAGQRAEALFANQEAIDHYQKALDCAGKLESGEQDPRQLAICLSLGSLSLTIGQYEEAERFLHQAKTLADERGHVGAQVSVCRWRARLAEVQSDYQTAQKWIEQGVAQAAGEETADLAQILLIAGLIHVRQGEYETALAQCERVLEIGVRLDEKRVLARAHNLLGISYLRGDSKTAVDNFEHAFSLYEEAGDIHGQATTHNLIANACFNLGRWPKAERNYRQAYQMFAQLGDLYNQAMAANNLGGIAKSRRLLDEAIVLYEEAVMLLERIGGSAWLLGVFEMNVGATYGMQGELTLANEHLEASRRLFLQAQSRDFWPEMLRHYGEVAQKAGDLAQADAYANEALTAARDASDHSEVGCCLALLADVRREQGDVKTAVFLLQESMAVLAEAGAEFELAHSRLMLAKLPNLEQQAQAAELAAQAAKTFKRLHAVWDYEQAVQVQARLDAKES